MIHDLALYNQQRQQEAKIAGAGVSSALALLRLRPSGTRRLSLGLRSQPSLFGLQMLRAASTSSWCLLLESVAESVIFVVCG